MVAQLKEPVLAYWKEWWSLIGSRCGGSMKGDVMAYWKQMWWLNEKNHED